MTEKIPPKHKNKIPKSSNRSTKEKNKVLFVASFLILKIKIKKIATAFIWGAYFMRVFSF